MAACLTFDHLTLGYGAHPAVHHLSGELEEGSLTAVVGANGSGKSTLLKGMAGTMKPMEGRVVRHACASTIAYLPQQTELDRTFPARVADLLTLGLWPRRGLFGRVTSEDRARIEATLDDVGLSGFADRPLDTLSGGQMQRALLGRLLLQDAQVLVLDEPFNALDEPATADMMRLIERWHREGRTIVAVLHDLALVRAHFPRTLLLARDPIAWGATAEVLTEDNLRRARQFDQAWDDAAPWCAGDDDGGARAKAALADAAP